MKKLTAGIFATLLAVVSADSAYAAIASKGYVDEQVGTVQTAVDTVEGDVSTLKTTVGQHTTQIAAKADSTTVTALDGRVEVAEGEIDTLQTEVAGKQDALGFTPENSANKTTTLSGTSTDAQYPSAKAVWDTIQTETTGIASDADVTALEGRVGTLETASKTHATKTELSSGLAAKANTADLGALATLNAVGSAQITDGAVATADIADKAVTEAKLSDTVNASLDLADSALQDADLAPYQTKVAADAAYAVKALEDQVGDVSATNMGTTATTVVTAIKEVAGEAADAATAAAGAKTAADTAQGDVDALEAVVNHETTGLAAAHTAIDALESGKLDKTGTAARATADAAGNVITTTYATKAEIADLPTEENMALKQDKTDNSLATTNKTVVGAINEVRGTANTASNTATAAQSAAAAAQEDATQALADAATAQEAAEAAQATADTKQDKLTGPVGSATQPVYVNAEGSVVAGTAYGTLATKSQIANADVANDAAIAQSKIANLVTDLAAKITAPKTSEAGETGTWVLTYDGTKFQWEDITRAGE